MYATNRFLVALVVGLSIAVVSQVRAQPAQPAPTPGNPAKITAHRAAALKKCTDKIAFESDKYVACMTKEGESP
jgi:hypothetical protein